MTDPKDDQQPSHDLEEATNRGVSSQDPAEGADDAPAGDADSPGEQSAG